MQKPCLKISLVGSGSHMTLGQALQTILKSATNGQMIPETGSHQIKSFDVEQAKKILNLPDEIEVARKEANKLIDRHFNKFANRIAFRKAKEAVAKDLVADYFSPKHHEVCNGHKFVVVTECGIEGHQQSLHMHIEHQWKNGGQ